MTEARARFPELLDRVRAGDWQMIGRRGRCEGVLADAEELGLLLARCCPFAPQVFVEEEAVGIYLDELDVHGAGATLDEAREDLVDATLEYIEAWRDHLHAAPNHREHVGHVRRLQMAGDREGIARVLFGDGGTATESR